MIVQPDFLEHWKTRYLIDLLDDPCAPLYVIRLWGHCQTRKTHGFPRVNPSVLKAICHAPHDAEKFESAIIEAGFVDMEGENWVVHEWDSVNASLIANWINGAKGGRPKKKTENKPMGLERGNPSISDKRREDKRREEVSPCSPPGGDDTGLDLEGEESKPGPRRRKKWTRGLLAAETYAGYPKFQAWWKAYPNGAGKRKAFDAWIILELEFVDQEPLFKVLDLQKNTPQWLDEGGKFVPHGSTYLNQRMFEDEIQKNKNGGGSLADELNKGRYVAG